jgi:hypothetical protein
VKCGTTDGNGCTKTRKEESNVTAQQSMKIINSSFGHSIIPRHKMLWPNKRLQGIRINESMGEQHR